jgi:prepilin-type N-terminal cleavage/methylation domain-containing protein
MSRGMQPVKNIMTDRSGFSLIELMITGIISAVIAGSVVAFISFADDMTRETIGLQQLQQESSLIGEKLLRDVRKGAEVCVGTDTEAPPNAVDNVQSITIRDINGSVIASYALSGNELLIDNAVYVTSHLCKFGNSSKFKVLAAGEEGVEFTAVLYKTFPSDTVYYTETIGEVRCRN